MSALRDHLIALLEDEREQVKHLLGKPMRHPLSGKPGFCRPDPYPDGVSSDAVQKFSRRIGIPIPSDVQEWLSITNAAPGYFGVCPRDDSDSMEWIIELNPDWKRLSWLPVARNEFGDYYIRKCDSEETAICMVEGTNSSILQYAAASDILHFARFDLEERVALNRNETYPWPFDKEFVLSKDPDLAKVTIAPLPWDEH